MVQNNPSNVANSINEYDFSALDEITQKQLTLSEVMKEATFYLLPIAGMLFFLFVFFNGLIPSINSMNTKLNEIDSLKKEYETLQNRIVKIKSIQKSAQDNQELIDKINFLVPSGRTSVVGFGDKIITNSAARYNPNLQHSIVKNVRKESKNPYNSKYPYYIDYKTTSRIIELIWVEVEIEQSDIKL